MKIYRLLLISLIPLTLFAQRRIIPHVTAPDSAFESKLILRNDNGASQTTTIKRFAEDGQLISEDRVTLDPVSQIVQEAHLWGKTPTAYIEIEGTPFVSASVSLERNTGQGSVVNLPETAKAATLWRFTPSLREGLFDGFAAVNVSANQALFVRQYDAVGNLVASKTYDGFEAGQKMVVLLNEDFKGNDGYFEVVGIEPFCLVALGGSYPGKGESLLWTAQATANRWSPETEMRLIKNLSKRSAQNGTIQYVSQTYCFCASVIPVRITEQDGEVIEMVHAETGDPVPANEWHYYTTIEKAFDLIQQAINSNYQYLFTDYDTEYGFPKEIQTDIHEMLADDGTSIIISDYKVINPQ